jgi:hypothetical protein
MYLQFLTKKKKKIEKAILFVALKGFLLLFDVSQNEKFLFNTHFFHFLLSIYDSNESIDIVQGKTNFFY